VALKRRRPARQPYDLVSKPKQTPLLINERSRTPTYGVDSNISRGDAAKPRDLLGLTVSGLLDTVSPRLDEALVLLRALLERIKRIEEHISRPNQPRSGRATPGLKKNIEPDRIGEIANVHVLLEYDPTEFETVLLPSRTLRDAQRRLRQGRIPFMYAGMSGAIFVSREVAADLKRDHDAVSISVASRSDGRTFP
jgi:hypothetical protein